MIEDELKEMFQEDLQLAWDRWLVMSFYKRNSEGVGKNVRIFMLKNKVDMDKMNTLLRFPKRFPYQWHISIGRFICGYLPPNISKTLWKHDFSRAEELARAINKMKADTYDRPTDVDKTKRETRERAKSKKDNLFAHVAKSSANKLFSSHRRRDQWGVTK